MNEIEGGAVGRFWLRTTLVSLSRGVRGPIWLVPLGTSAGQNVKRGSGSLASPLSVAGLSGLRCGPLPRRVLPAAVPNRRVLYGRA
jgi:hypothetical protein